MALYKITGGILNGKPFDIQNHGEIQGDFTCVTDLVTGIRRLIDAVPQRPERAADIAAGGEYRQF
jgi:UDP-glucuronate 4-epimerase